MAKNRKPHLMKIIISLLLSTYILAQDPVAIVNKEIWEQVIYENNVLNDKGYGYYQMTISERYFDGTQSLAIKVLPEQYDSDPDLFISINNTKPTSSLDSQWYCTKDGSDTCIINRNSLSQGLTLYIGVQCTNPCQYTLASDYISLIEIKNANSTQVRLDGYSSTIFSYLVPSVNTNGITRAVEIKIISEDQYNPIELYFSLDSNIYQIEERKVENILSNGVGYIFTENDYGWCTGCYIYLLADVLREGRYYVSFTATPRTSTIDSRPANLMVNERQQECVVYFVLAAENDLMLYTSQFQGDTDFYISGSTKPSDNNDARILQYAARTPHRCLILSAEDRARWGFRTGVINICAYAFSQSSLLITPLEDNAGGRFDARDGVTYTFNMEKNSSTYFRFTQNTFNQNGNITVTATTYGLNVNQAPSRIFYKICSSSDPLACSLNETEQRGTGMIELATGWANVTNAMTRTATFVHNRTKCPNQNSCYYLINVFFPDQNGPKKMDFSVSFNTTQYHEVSLEQTFKNIIQQGQYFYYALMPGSSESFAFMKSLTIKLVSEIGDADLVVSVVDPSPEIDQGQFEARGSNTYDSISLNQTGNFTLNRPIYIGVYAQTFCVYRLSFEPTFNLDYNAKLVSAIPITDSIAYPNKYYTEFQETFYSFTPWWAGYENRSMIFFAEVTFNNIFFHIKANDYPMFYLSEYKDKNDIIVINPGDPAYSLSNGYYIRIRPDFQLQDLISDREYIFNFYAFTQLQNTQMVDIQLNELRLGYANASSVYYRHFIVENNATYNFSVIPIIGNPAILLKLSNIPVRPQSSDVTSWDYKSDNDGKLTDSIVNTFQERSSRNATCEQAGFNLNAGNRSCGFYIAVECTSECIFNITVQIKGRENQVLPKYLLEDDYYTGQVSYGQYSYFYYPLSKQTGEMVIILNKTGSLGKNGDSMVVANLMSDSQSRPISNWSYPTVANYSMGSANYRPSQPEIIELCSQVISTKCTSQSCILMLGVLGLTRNQMSNFRIIVQKQQNKLYDKNPIIDTVNVTGQYKYYWFTSNVSVSNPNTFWEYQITASPLDQGKDVDVYVSILDGRYPVAEDYDFASENMGADSVYINSRSSFFDDSGYNKTNGMLFIVGVRALTPDTAYTLMMTGPNQPSVTIQNLTTGTMVQRGLQGTNANNRTNYFKWFNWGQKDFRFNIEVSSGNVSVFLNYVGEEVFLTNGFQALPFNQNNSRWLVYLNASQAGVLQVSKNDIGAGKLFCYFCWYYITVTTNFTAGPTSYRLTVNEVPDVGEEVQQLALNTSVALTLPATGTVSQRKFILDCKDPFTIKATVTAGYLIMFVGLYPEAPRTKYQFYAEGSSNVQIDVRQTDLNFKVGAWYYITLQSGQGRTVFSLQINQRKTVQQLENGIIYKDQYWNTEERIKLYYFQAPTYRTPQFRAAITVQSLSPGFYPTILINKLTLTAAPTDATRLTYPNIKQNNISFGDNFFAIANQNNFTYQFRETGGSFVYFTMAMYSFSYGMTDKKKPAFKISLTIDNKTISMEHFEQSTFANRFILPKYYNHEHTDYLDNDWEDDAFINTSHPDNNLKPKRFSKHEGHRDGFEVVEYVANKIDTAFQKVSNYMQRKSL